MRLIPKNDLRLDDWTYGDWTQFVAFLPGNRAQCCRRAWLPTILSMIGCGLFVAMVLGLLFIGPPNGAGLFLFWLAGAFQAMIAIELATRSLWMIMLGPVMTVNDDGGFYRLFPGERGDDE